MRHARVERAGMAPVIFISLLLHLALLYPLVITGRHAEPVRVVPGSVVAYLDLRGDEPASAAAGHRAGAGEASAKEKAKRPDAPAVAAGVAPDGVFRSPPAVPPVRVPSASIPPPSAVPAAPAGGAVDVAAPHPDASAQPDAGAKGGGKGGDTAAGVRHPAVASSGAASTSHAGADGQPGGGYLARLRGLIEARKHYPLAARRSGREGSCRRRFFLRRDGALRRVETVTSCGHPFLDAAATRAISSVGSFPPVPAGLSTEEPFEVIITFALNGR